MPFEWKSFVGLARDLYVDADKSGHPEACRRTAISRAYFAAFCHARNYAIEFLHFAHRDDPDDHGRLRAHLKAKRRAGDAARLDQLRQWRNGADYDDDLGPVDLSFTALSAVTEAQKVFDSLVPPVKR
jgi:hypothetical protein